MRKDKVVLVGKLWNDAIKAIKGDIFGFVSGSDCGVEKNEVDDVFLDGYKGRVLFSSVDVLRRAIKFYGIRHGRDIRYNRNNVSCK